MKWHFYVKNPSKNQGKILLFKFEINKDSMKTQGKLKYKTAVNPEYC